MQERRTLIYMDKDDIPSTALEVTSEALTGNVLYLPIVEYGNASSSNAVYIYGADGVGCSETRTDSTIAASSINANTGYQLLWQPYANYLTRYMGGLYSVFICPVKAKSGFWDSKISYPANLTPQAWCIGKYAKLVFMKPVVLSNFLYTNNNSGAHQYFGTRSVNAYGAYIDNE